MTWPHCMCGYLCLSVCLSVCLLGRPGRPGRALRCGGAVLYGPAQERYRRRGDQEGAASGTVCVYVCMYVCMYMFSCPDPDDGRLILSYLILSYLLQADELLFLWHSSDAVTVLRNERFVGSVHVRTVVCMYVCMYVCACSNG
jgi:hypothetical protein